VLTFNPVAGAVGDRDADGAETGPVTAERPDIESEYPGLDVHRRQQTPCPVFAVRLETHAGDQHRMENIPQLIASLDSDDPAVRLFAIQALERITGERFGYVPYAPPHKRRAAVDRWADAYEAGRFSAKSDSRSGDPTDTPDKQPS